jgi:hypothetical protein
MVHYLKNHRVHRCENVLSHAGRVSDCRLHIFFSRVCVMSSFLIFYLCFFNHSLLMLVNDTIKLRIEFLNFRQLCLKLLLPCSKDITDWLFLFNQCSIHNLQLLKKLINFFDSWIFLFLLIFMDLHKFKSIADQRNSTSFTEVKTLTIFLNSKLGWFWVMIFTYILC